MNLKFRSFLLSGGYIYILLAYCFIIPVLPKLGTLLTIIFFLFWLLEGRFKQRFKILTVEKYRLWFILPVLFFLCHCIRFIFSNNNPDYELFDIQTKLFLIILPVLLSILPSCLFEKKNIEKYFTAFIFGFLTYTIYTLLKASYLCLFEQAAPHTQFFYSKLSNSIHPGYASMFGVFALVFCFYLKCQEKTIIPKQIINVIIWVIPMYILLLSSRAGIISLFFVLIVFVFYGIRKRKNFLHPILLTIFLLALQVIAIQWASVVKSRYESTVQALDRKEPGEKKSDARVVVWKASLKGISEHFWFGVGTGEVKNTIAMEAEKQGESEIAALNLNAHNQFLQTFLALGMFGFLILLSCFIVPFIIGVKHKFLLLIVFSFLVGFNNLIESMLERHTGNLFFGFFFCFFILQCFTNNKLTNKKSTN